MNKNPSICWLIFSTLLLLGAAPTASVGDLLRQGNEAFHDREYQKALEFYQQAEERSLDPGLVAYNKALSLYQLGQYREAELHFRRCLEDASAGRRTQGLYGLGNSLLMQAGDTNPRLLLKAIESYQLCRQEKKLDGQLRNQVNHNLELAKLLLVQAKAKAAQQPPEPPSQGKDPSQQNQDGSDDPMNKNSPGSENSDKVDPGKGKKNLTNKDLKKGKDQNTIPTPGNPPVIPDEDALVPLPREDTAWYLQQLADRIQQQQQEHQASKNAPVPGVRDW